MLKTKKYLSESEIKKTKRLFTKLKKVWDLTNFVVILIALIMKTLIIMIIIMILLMDDEYRKIGSIRTLFKELYRDYYKSIRTDSGFAGRNDN